MRHRKVHPVEKKSFVELIDKAISDENQLWGWHTIYDMQGCKQNVADGEQVKALIKELIKELKMEQVGETTLKYFGEGKKRDLSAIALITTSTITIHTDSNLNRVFIDVFSCKSYEPKLIDPIVKKYFSPEQIASIFILRSGHHIKVIHNY